MAAATHLLYPDARYHIAAGATGSGKSEALAASYIEWSSTRERGERFVLMTPSSRQMRENVEPLFKTLTGGRAYFDHHTGHAMIGGQRHMLFSAENEQSFKNFRGPSVKGAFVEELTLCAYSTVMELETRLRRPGAKFYASTNPDVPRHWARHKYVLPRGSDRHVIDDFVMADNPGLPAGFREALEAQLTGAFADRMIRGLWVAAEGQIFQHYTVGDAPEAPHDYVISADKGSATVTHALQIGRWADSTPDWIMDEWRYSHAERGRLTEDDQAIQIREELGQRDGEDLNVSAVVVDPAAPGLIEALQKVFDCPVIGGVHDVKFGIIQTDAALARGLLCIDSRCDDLLADIEGYGWDKRAADRGEDKPVKANDHGPDAMRYYVATAYTPPPVVFHPWQDVNVGGALDGLTEWEQRIFAALKG